MRDRRRRFRRCAGLHPGYKNGEGAACATNRKRLVVPTSMGAGGFEVLKTRDDVEVIPFPPMISSPDFNALLRADGEVNGAILGLTRFGETEAQNAKGLQVVSRIGVGYDTVDVPALIRHKVPLMVAGTANSPSVAGRPCTSYFALAKRGAGLNMVGDRWGDRFRHTLHDLTTRPC
jgi:D-3-phosphoglycerate dehydrogenase